MFLGGRERVHWEKMGSIRFVFKIEMIYTLLTFTCSKSTIETLEKDVKYIQR